MPIKRFAEFVSEKIKIVPLSDEEFNKIPGDDVSGAYNEKLIHKDAFKIANMIREHCLVGRDLLTKYNNYLKQKITAYNWDVVESDKDIRINWKVYDISLNSYALAQMFSELFEKTEFESGCDIFLLSGNYLMFDEKKPIYLWKYNHKDKEFENMINNI